ncbi:BQ2448_2224 [Microbotryum intermedium]|uniref:BQ2448_2224 protein n=1 Tax=Microbotryum intermedium TaxID=269621 RepID=A0A238FBC8_9BASI|nr:BQ2448_2224 [Microbotryum intermedium]
MNMSPTVRNRLRIALLGRRPFVRKLRTSWPLVVAVGLIPRAQILSVARRAGPTVSRELSSYEGCRAHHSATQLASMLQVVRHSMVAEQAMSYREMETVVLYLLQTSDLAREDLWNRASGPLFYYLTKSVAEFAVHALKDIFQYPEAAQLLTIILLNLERPQSFAHLFGQVCTHLMDQLLVMAFELLQHLAQADASTNDALEIRDAMIHLMHVLEALQPTFSRVPTYKAFRSEIVRLYAQSGVMDLVGDEVAQVILETLYDSTNPLHAT